TVAAARVQILLNNLVFEFHFWLICRQPISGQDKTKVEAYSVCPNNAKPNVACCTSLIKFSKNV
ncbi:MAG: hypothetical protein EAZ13_10585, partial [Sphingobacteriia bacterium]